MNYDGIGYQKSVTQTKQMDLSHTMGEVRAKKPSLTQPGDQQLKCNFRTITNGRASGLLVRIGSLNGNPSKQQPLGRRRLIRSSCDNRCTRYTTQ
ncbi:hypothetical protein J6590_050892 [Homalodisca vitripennis]|nr:hypothetical protein J6590_050892 [Homalodisca vitripennis]